MSQYSPQEPREDYQSHNPYNTYNPYNAEQAQPTYVAQPASIASASGGQRQGKGPATMRIGPRIWNALLWFLGERGLVVAGGAVLAILTFYLLPYYSFYSAHFLAADVLDDKWWLELILPLLALAGVIAVQKVPSLKQNKRTWSLLITGSGLLGILINYWFMNGEVSSNYWRLGTWSYFLAMALVAIGGILLAM